MGYTTFDYSALEVDAVEIPTHGTIGAHVTVTNTGARSGTELVQFYVSHRAQGVTRPAQQLVAFARVDLEPGESKLVRIDIWTGQIPYLGLDDRFTFEPGPIQLQVGSSSEDIRARVTITAGGAAADWSNNRPLLPRVEVGDVFHAR